jgi:sulfur-oxidizing protein SoxY
MTHRLTRRQAMAVAAATALFSAAPLRPAEAANDSADIIRKFTGGKEPVKGKVSLDLPEIAENGNTVPITVAVESPMTEADHVTDVLVVADGNPRGGVVTFHFTAQSGVAEAATRIRLAETQNVVAIARTSKGDLFMETKQVKVTIGGCGG